MCMWVEPLYHPSAAMSVIGFSFSVTNVTSPGLISTSACSGRYSKPFTASMCSLPAGTSKRVAPVVWNTCSREPCATRA